MFKEKCNFRQIMGFNLFEIMVFFCFLTILEKKLITDLENIKSICFCQLLKTLF